MVLVAGLLMTMGFGEAATKLTLTGSSTVAPLALEIAKRFESLHPGIRVDVQSGGSSRGLADARQGLSDIGMVSRALKPGENDVLAFPIARDGIAMRSGRRIRLSRICGDTSGWCWRSS